MKATLLLASLAIASVVSAAGQVFFEETFSDSNWQDRWTISTTKDDLGVFALSSGTFYADKDYAQGLQTSQDARFYSISAPFTSVVDNSKDDLIVQYTVKQEVNQECGGSYIKLLPEGFDAHTFNGDSEYAIMFGPDVCGTQNRVHVIFHHNGKNFLTKKEFPVPKDTKTHLYRLTVHPDQKYSLQIDGDVKADRVALEDHWDVYAPRMIADPNDKKPADWVEEEHVVDESHKKPENYDQIPRTIPDPEAKQPEDWDAEADGDWEVPVVDNPEFEEWEPKMMVNPAYKGEWKPSEIPNPQFKEDPTLAHYRIGGVGLDLWQVNSGSIFDDFVVTTDKAVADKYLGRWKENNAKEKELVAEIEAKAAKEKEAKEKEAKEKEEAEKLEGDARAAADNTFGKKEDVEAADGEDKKNNKDKKKIDSDGFDELDELDDDEQPEQNRHDEL
ncbi:MAG: calreticulin-like protein [Linnemannia gamsii]|nr:MAG: calreticulin-like protein [Linnemannia gamsii]